MANTTRERIVDVSSELFRRNGYHGTGIKQIVSGADARFASLYHFFPGGKEELGEEVIRRSGEFYLQIWEVILGGSPDIVTGVRNFFAGAAATVSSTDYADACPIATVALEVASTNEPLRQATADVFESWIVTVAARFERAGIDAAQSRDIAIELIAILEGAFVLSRAMRTTAPIEIAGRRAVAIVEAALG